MMLEPLEDGFLVRSILSNTWQLHWWILSQGDSMVVEQPPELRAQIGKTLHRAAAAYRPLDAVAGTTGTVVSLQNLAGATQTVAPGS